MNDMPLLSLLEERYDPRPFNKWIQENWTLSVYASVIYVIVVVFIGKKLMQNRKPYDLRKPLLAWNIGLAAFSIMGSIALIPGLYRVLISDGFVSSVCWTDVFELNYKALWSSFFTLSKLLELFDTVFIVLRKSPLIFLHYYHHVTVLIYAWYGHSHNAAIGLWFGCMNYAVHSVMYSYYALRSAGVRVPSIVMQIVTLLQLSQMAMGLVCNYTATKLLVEEKNCMMSWDHVYIGSVIYASYAILFANFFYRRYIMKKEVK